VLGHGAEGRLRPAVALQARLAVDLWSRAELSKQGGLAAGGYGDSANPRQAADAKRVERGQLQGVISRHGGDRADLDLGSAVRQHDGERVIVARIAVQDDPPRPAHGPALSGRISRKDLTQALRWPISGEVAASVRTARVTSAGRP
jgi:hypothetical protein